MRDTLEFTGLVDLLRWVDSTDHRGQGDSSTRAPSQNWDNNVSWDGARKIAMAGGHWPEGARMIVDGMATAASMTATGQAPMFSYDVAGAFPDVPSYLAGDPASMVDVIPNDVVGQKPVVRIGVSSFYWGTEAREAINRGVAIMSLVNALEADGQRCEVVMIWDTMHGSDVVECRVTAKHAHEQWAPDTVAFCIAHPAAFRRLAFAVFERCPAGDNACRSNYGRGVSDIQLEGFDIVFPYVTDARVWSDLEDALYMAQNLARQQGVHCTLIEDK